MSLLPLLQSPIAICGTIVAGATLIYLLFAGKKRWTKPVIKDAKENVVYLFQPEDPKTAISWGYPVSKSPFCAKVHLFCEFFDIPYEIVPSPMKLGPHGKWPFIIYNEKVIGESDNIIAFLEEEFDTKSRFESSVDPVELAIAHAFKSVLEDCNYFVVLHSRWGRDDFFHKALVPTFFSEMPTVLKWFIPGAIRKSVIEKMKSAGYYANPARPPMVFYQKGIRNLEAIDAWLGTRTNTYLFGDKPTKYDAIFYGFLASNATTAQVETVVSLAAKDCPNIVKYLDNITDIVFKN